jgi:hypothetical protein
MEQVATNAALSQASQDSGPMAAEVMEKLQGLENLVRDLRGQLEQANAVTAGSIDGLPGVNSTEGFDLNRNADQTGKSLATNNNSLQKQFGRMVLQDGSQSRYISSGFWSRVNDEVLTCSGYAAILRKSLLILTIA